MLTIAVMLAICALVIEFVVVARIHWLRQLVATNLIANLVSSLTISWALGAIFGAKGVTVLTAAMLATALSVPIYRVIYFSSKLKKRLNGKARRLHRRSLIVR